MKAHPLIADRQRPPTPTPAPRPKAGKVVRWIDHLSESQLRELGRRIAAAREPDVGAASRIRAVLIAFAQHMPP